MRQQLENIKKQAEHDIVSVSSIQELESFRVRYLGKKGELTGILRGMANVSAAERPIIGQLSNEVRAYLEEIIENLSKELLIKQTEEKIKSESIDVTVPGTRPNLGRRHPLTQTIDSIKDIFIGLGYEIAEGPEVEYDYYNFEAMNIPKYHPARDVQSTFYITENILLRTHTSPVQARIMKEKQPPIKVICPGRVYRSDEIDATHSPVFHQVEGLVVDKGVTMGDLVGTLQVFAEKTFGENTKIRLRPHHFRFTEPSAEVDVSCWVCQGKGCRLCKNEGWVEILGAGMVNPKVFSECGLDPDIYTGFAFGMGVERIALAKFDIDDMRLLYENDIRFLKQF